MSEPVTRGSPEGGLRAALGFLRCPRCGAELALAGAVVGCASGHAFDVARQGYLNLAGGDARAPRGDSPAMVEARAGVLGAGHFEPLAQAIADAAAEAGDALADGCVIDVGAGPGYYLARTLERLPGRIGLALDASRPAARRAARAHPRMAAIVCDAWRGLPARDAAAAVVLNVFAPRAGAEIARVLHPRGALVVATPTPRHLEELVGSLGLLTVDRSKQERLDRTLGRELRPAHRRECAWVMTLGHEDVRRLVGMGPSARHLDAAALDARLRALPDPVAVTASATVSVYRRVAEAGGNGR